MSKHRKLAIIIAKAVMTVQGPKGEDVTVERIAMMKRQRDGSEKNLGGLCTSAAVAEIERILNEELGT